jgi:hypothetical protein
MKTLHKLFLKKHLVTWIKMLLIGFALFFLTVLVVVFKINFAEKFFAFIMISYFLIVPTVHAYHLNNEFQANLDWLINFQFNRKQLVQYFFYIQTIKLSLMMLAYFLFFGIPMLLHRLVEGKSQVIKEGLQSYGIQDTLLNWGTIGSFYPMAIFAIFSFYAGALLKTNLEQIRRQQIKSQTQNLNFNFKKTLKIHNPKTIFILSIALIFAFTSYFNIFFVYLAIVAAIGYLSVVIFNRRFRVFKNLQQNLIGTALAIFLMIPHFIIVLQAKNEVENKRAHYKDRLDSLEYINGILSVPQPVFEQLSRNSLECHEFNILARIARQNDIAPTVIIHENIDYCSLEKIFWKYTAEDANPHYFSSLVDQARYYIKKMDLNEEKQIQLGNALSMKKKLLQQEVIDLFEQKDAFSVTLALNLARNNFKSHQYNTLVKTYKDTIPKSLLDIPSVKRAIASSPDQVRDQHPILDKADKMIEDL